MRNCTYKDRGRGNVPFQYNKWSAEWWETQGRSTMYDSYFSKQPTNEPSTQNQLQWHGRPLQSVRLHTRLCSVLWNVAVFTVTHQQPHTTRYPEVKDKKVCFQLIRPTFEVGHFKVPHGERALYAEQHVARHQVLFLIQAIRIHTNPSQHHTQDRV